MRMIISAGRRNEVTVGGSALRGHMDSSWEQGPSRMFGGSIERVGMAGTAVARMGGLGDSESTMAVTRT